MRRYNKEFAKLDDMGNEAASGVKKTTNSTATNPSTNPSASASKNYYTPKYQGTSFLDWYKTNYGYNYDDSGLTRLNGMNDVDWEQGNNLYKWYQWQQDQEKSYDSAKSDLERQYQNNIKSAQRNRNYSTREATRKASESLGELERYYNLANESLEREKDLAQQNASIMYDKLKKYLPEQIKAQGLGGLGVSESAMLDAYNAYLSSMGTIASDYQKNKTSIENNYQDNRRSTESERDSAIREADYVYDTSVANYGENNAQRLFDLKTKYNQDTSNRRQQAEDDVSDILNRYKEEDEQQEEIIDKIKSELENYEEAGDYEGALKFIRENKTYFNGKTQEYDELYNKMNGLKEKQILEGEQLFSYKGKQYRIQSRLNSASNEISNNRDFSKQLKDAGFTGPYDPNIPNGTTFEIHCESNGANTVDINDFAANLGDWKAWVIPGYSIYEQAKSIFNWETRNVTYYDGKWYLSKKQ